MIDPGHGGNDHGATGPSGIMEKKLTLAISKRLAVELKKQIGAEVALTRTDDRYVSLEDRNAIGNRMNADLFVSIHVNAAESSTPKGIETYYLNTATNKAAQRLADRENKAFGKEIGTLQRIITTLHQNATTDESHELAYMVQTNLVRGVSKKFDGVVDKRVKTALFYVLVGSKAPSILVECGFVSNPQEEKRLNSAVYQQELAASIAAGIQQYLKSGKAAQRTL